MYYYNNNNATTLYTFNLFSTQEAQRLYYYYYYTLLYFIIIIIIVRATDQRGRLGASRRSPSPPLAIRLEIPQSVLAIAATMPSINDRLISAVRRGDVKDVETLLNFGANPRCKDKTPAEWPALYLAVRHNHPECLRHLLAAGARHNSRASETNMTPLLMACEMGHLGCVHVLLGAGADPNAWTT